jgi:hypothetical protein
MSTKSQERGIEVSLDDLKLGNKISLGVKLLAGLSDEEVNLILVEKHNGEYIFDVVYHGLVLCQVATKQQNGSVQEWETWA